MGKWKVKEWWSKAYRLNEIYTSGMEFAFVSQDGRQVHPFAFCKDFLQDVVHAFVNNKSLSIYGLNYKPERDPPPDLHRTRIVVRNVEWEAAEAAEKAINAGRFLNAIEREAGIKRTKVKFVGNNEVGGGIAWDGAQTEKKTAPVFAFLGSSIWMKAPPLLSFYTFAIRAGGSYKGGAWREWLRPNNPEITLNDRSYLKASNKFWDRFLTKDRVRWYSALSMKKAYPANLGTHDVHDQTGFSTVGGLTAPHVKTYSGPLGDWYRMFIEGG